MITVAGVDGGPLPEVVRERLAGAALVAGAARHMEACDLDAAGPPEAARRIALGNVSSALREIGKADESGRDVVVLASGDPGLFGIVRALRERGHRPEVIPARSSVALAFARAGLPWDDALVVSAHGREPRRAVNACRAHPKVAVLTGPGAGPAELAAALENGPPRTLIVCEELGGPEERVTRCAPAEAAVRTWRDPNVVLVLDEARTTGGPGCAIGGPGLGIEGPGWVAGAPPGPAGWALPEDSFDHRGSLITKAEVRALVLARLGPRLGDLVWDVGAGSGSVGIECARLGAAAVAVERDPEACDRIAANARAHGVDVRVHRGVAPEALARLPDPDAVFAGGGGPEALAACAARGPRVLVAAFAAVDRVPRALEILGGHGYRADGVQLQASRLSPLPGGATRLAAANPVFVVWGAP